MRGVDVLVHLAAAGVSPKPATWSEQVGVNVIHSLRLLELGEAVGLSRFVVAGTSHEYGTASLRYSEIPPDAPLEPINPYGASKAAAFQLLRTYSIQQGLKLFYGRIFTVYGEGQFEANFWPSLRRAALAGKDFPMTSGRQITDFIPVASVAAHLLAACMRPDISPGIPLVANIGSGEPRSLLDFAKKEWNRMGAMGNLMPGFIPDRLDQIYRTVPDLSGLSFPTISFTPIP
jgi:nucleoside-diphosphate-sugar epimerase